MLTRGEIPMGPWCGPVRCADTSELYGVLKSLTPSTKFSEYCTKDCAAPMQLVMMTSYVNFYVNVY